ncbi:MAG: methyltransferase domain-containing protein [Chloroflexota bacterium]
MTTAEAISTHYENGGNLLDAIKVGIAKLGKTPETITIDDIAPVDEFHIGGRPATVHFANQLNFTAEDHVLDVGCGMGGASRFVASTYGSRVTGVDITEEYINTGKVLTQWVGLDDKVSLQTSSAQTIPFDDNSFDGAYMIHVGMNIPDKAAVFAEVRRVLKPGATFGIYDIMEVGQGDFAFPVPWANEASLSHLASPDGYKKALETAGFEVSSVNSRRDSAVEFFARMRERAASGAGPAPLGLHVLMKDSTPTKVKNMIGNLEAGLIAPVEIVAKK